MYGIENVMSGSQKISADQSGESFIEKDKPESRKIFER